MTELRGPPLYGWCIELAFLSNGKERPIEFIHIPRGQTRGQGMFL